MHRVVFGTMFFDKGSPFSYSGVAQGERHWVGVGILRNPRLATTSLNYVPVHKRITFLQLKVVERKTDCSLYQCNKQQLRILGLLVSIGWVPGKGATNRLHILTG